MLILISRSDQKYHNSEHSNFVVELKIKFFNVHEFPIVQEFQKKQKTTLLIHKRFRNIRKILFGFKISSSSLSESKTGFTNPKT